MTLEGIYQCNKQYLSCRVICVYFVAISKNVLKGSIFEQVIIVHIESYILRMNRFVEKGRITLFLSENDLRYTNCNVCERQTMWYK